MFVNYVWGFIIIIISLFKCSDVNICKFMCKI